MSESETPVAPGDPNAGAAIVLRMLQGAHPEDAEIVRDWLTTLPARLHVLTKERDEFCTLASRLMDERKEKIATLDRLAEESEARERELEGLIAQNRRQAEEFMERTDNLARVINDALQQYAEAISGETNKATQASQ